jgi:hypothetical protein
MMLNITCLLYDGEMTESALRNFKPWALDSAGREVTKKIEIQSVYTSIYIVCNLIVTFAGAILYVIPVENDKEIFFACYLFQRLFPNYGFVLNWLYRLTFIALGLAGVTTFHAFIYGVQHMKFQLFLFWEYEKNITDIEEYNNIGDVDLLKNTDFQSEVANRIKFCVKRQIEMLQ